MGGAHHGRGLSSWFGNQATIDLRPGGSAQMTWSDGHTVDMRIERVEEPAVFGFTWPIFGLPGDDPRRTYVEFTLEATGTGTRLTVTESGFAQVPEDVTPHGLRRQHPAAGRRNWASWSTTSMLPDAEAIAEQVFVALADPPARHPGRTGVRRPRYGY